MNLQNCAVNSYQSQFIDVRASKAPMAKSPPVTTSNASTSQVVPLQAPALLRGEDSAAYDKLFTEISETVRPSDILDEMGVRDVTDLSWEIARLRRLKSQLLSANIPRGLRVILESMCSYREAEELCFRWAKREALAVQQVDDLLAAAGLTMDEVMAETLAVKISDFERIDRLIMNAEARRNSVLREIDRRRAARSNGQRRRIDDVEEAQFVEIEPSVRRPRPNAQ